MTLSLTQVLLQSDRRIPPTCMGSTTSCIFGSGLQARELPQLTAIEPMIRGDGSPCRFLTLLSIFKRLQSQFSFSHSSGLEQSNILAEFHTSPIQGLLPKFLGLNLENNSEARFWPPNRFCPALESGMMTQLSPTKAFAANGLFSSVVSHESVPIIFQGHVNLSQWLKPYFWGICNPRQVIITLGIH